MKVAVLYHPKSDHGGLVADFAQEFERYKAKKVELVSLESIEGADLAKLYDVTTYPAVLAMSDSGSLQRMWQGLPMPLMDELSYYVSSDHSGVSHTGRMIPVPA